MFSFGKEIDYMSSIKLNRKTINAILKEYGGASCFSLNDDVHDGLLYNNTIDIGAVLTICVKYDKSYNPFIEVHLSDNKGINKQIDCYEILFETDLYLKSSLKKGHEIEYPDKKIAYVGPYKKKSAKKLEKDLQQLLIERDHFADLNKRLLDNAEQNFVNSTKYNEMAEQIKFLELSLKSREQIIEELEVRISKQEADINQLYIDNKKMIDNIDSEAYFIGLTENWHVAWEYDKLKQEINYLNGKIKANSILLAQKDDEINNLLNNIAAEKNKTQANDNSVSAIALEKAEAAIKQNREERARNCKTRSKKTKTSNETMNMVLALRNKGYSIRDISRQTGVSIGWVHELVKRNISD